MTITTDYLDKLISNSLYPEDLIHVLNLEKNNNTIKDYGSFLGLKEPCSISLGIISSDETPAPNMDSENLKLSENEKQKIFNILSSHNYNVSLTNPNPANIYISDSGIKLPYLKPEEAMALLSDVIDDLKANDVKTYGFAHPLVKSSFVKCVVDTGYYRNSIDVTSHANTNILDNQSFEDFVGKMLTEAENKALSESDISIYIQENYGKSIYRGGTTGNHPYAILSRSCTKDFLYGSNDFETAKRYSGELRSYKPVNGKKYGFIYEYEADANQKYYSDYQIENGCKGFGLEGASIGCETPIYEHKNKIKGIYLNIDGKICKIANKNGYISKDWEDFAKLHTLEFTVENPIERERRNALLKLSESDEVASSYTKRNYDAQVTSFEEYRDKYLSQNNNYSSKLLLTGTVNQDILNNFSTNLILRNATLEDVTYCDCLLSGNIKLKNYASENLKLYDAYLSSDTPLNLKNIYASGEISLDKIDFINKVNIIGKNCKISNSYLKNVNLDKIKNLIISGDTYLSENCELPKNITFKNAHIQGNVNLQNIDMALDGNITFGKDIKLPKELPFYNNVKSITLTEDALKKTSIPESYFVIITDENEKPKSILYNKNNTSHIQAKEKYKELQLFNSVESYRKCKETENLLSSWGIDKDSYMMFTKDDNIHTTYNNDAKSIYSYFEDGENEIFNNKEKVVYGRNNGVIAAYFDNGVYIISKDEKLKSKLYYKGKDVNLGVMMSNGEQFCDENGNPNNAKNNKWQNIQTKTNDNKTVISETEIKTPETEVKTEELHETLKKQAEAAQQKTEVPQTAITDDNLRNTLKTQQKNSGIGGKASSVSNNIDAAFEKIGAALNDNAVGRTINTMDRWRPNNKVAAKAVDKVGVVPVAAIVGSGVAAYEQYKSGDTKGAAATMGKGVVHASVQGAATAVGINAAAKGAAKASEKITAKVVERKAAKTTTKSAAKAAGKAAGKAVGKSILKKIPLVSLGAGAYFAYDRAKNGEWGKAGCELLSGALGCFPGVGTAASTAVDCGLAAADVKQSINETKKQQAAEQNKPQTTEQQKNPQMAKRINELRGNKTEQKKAVKAKPVEKNIFDRLKDSFLSR